jgi:predicted nucleic acid-binding protein
MIRAVFADTFYWIALANAQDLSHEAARTYAGSLRDVSICTTEAVLTEYLNHFAAWGPNLRWKATMTVESILVSPNVHVLPHTSAVFRRGLDLYGARRDKGYSLTDCMSMDAMRLLGIQDVLTNDRHFEQEGFRALFREL